MANSKPSIAGVAHGAKSTPAAAPPKQWYPQLSDKVDPEVSRAIQTIFDNLYDLRNRGSSGSKDQKTADDKSSTEGDKSGAPPQSNFATGIQGIAVKGITDSTVLKEGATLVYSATEGQFIIKVP